MKTYILVDPFTNKPIYFTTYYDNNHVVVQTSTNAQGETIVERQNALCIEHAFDADLLSKIYDPLTGTFN